MSEFSIGDRVKAISGEKGQIVALNADGTSAYVQMDRGYKGTITRLRLDNLTRIDGGGPASNHPDGSDT